MLLFIYKVKYAEVKLVRTQACGKEDSRVLGCALRWHTTHRSGTSAMRVSRGAMRHTSQKSTADTVVGVPASSLVSSSF